MGAYILALASAAAFGAVEEVLLQAVAHAVTELGARAADGAAGSVAGVGVVALGVGTHDGLALLVAAGALSGSALQAVAAVLTIRGGLVGGTVAAVARTDFLWVAATAAGAADGAGGFELAA